MAAQQRRLDSHRGELVRIPSHLTLTTQPPAALVEMIPIRMQLFFNSHHVSVSVLLPDSV